MDNSGGWAPQAVAIFSQKIRLRPARLRASSRSSKACSPVETCA
jgi:hypothetical protein